VKLAISNIAWPQEEEARVRELMAEQGIDGVEVAPTMIWPDPLAASEEEIRAYRARWEDRGIAVVAMQALLFGHPELTLFEDDASRAATLAHLRGIARVAGLLGAGPLVFGSPKNRRRGELASERAVEVAERFFRAAGQAALDQGACLCLEPNPPQYECDFATDAASALELVRRVDHPGFGLHLDAAGMRLAGDPVAESIRSAGPWLRHFHASEAFLAPVGDPPADGPAVDHASCADALRDLGYGGFVSVEMRHAAERPTLVELARVASFLRETYGG